MQRKLANWSTEDKNRKFYRLLRIMADPKWLKEAARITLGSDGAKTPGIDKVTRQTFQDNLAKEIKSIREELLAGTYQPSPVRRVYIPKADGKKRPLGIPTLRDRVVQRAMLMVMDPIWESDFHDKSYGFRLTRSVHDAVHTLKMQLTNKHDTSGRWVIEGDLSCYFDTVHHKLLVKAVKKRINDKRLINLLWKFLKAGHIDRNIFRMTSEGVPQGGVSSPLLANIMLHEFDTWMEKNHIGYKTKSRIYNWNTGVRARTSISIKEKREIKPLFSYCRYADDFVITVKGGLKEAERMREQCREFLEAKLRLKLNMEKTLITHVNDGFDFLGYRLIRKRNGRGKMTVVTMIPWKKYRKFIDALLPLFADKQPQPDEIIEQLNRKIGGWSNFYRYADHTAKTYGRIDTVVFWKFAHWIAGKYGKRITNMMAKHCKRPDQAKPRTWCWHVTGAKRIPKAVYLSRLVGSTKAKHARPRLTVNPYALEPQELKDKQLFVSPYKEIANVAST